MEDDKISKALAASRLKAAKREVPDQDEVKALEHVIKLYGVEADAKKVVKDAQAALDVATLKKYGDLVDADVKALVLDTKWRRTITSRVSGEVFSLTLSLVARIRELGERYGDTVAELGLQLEKLEAKNAGHLAEMGVE
jgi:type I restriction enzyme M protein